MGLHSIIHQEFFGNEVFENTRNQKMAWRTGVRYKGREPLPYSDFLFTIDQIYTNRGTYNHLASLHSGLNRQLVGNRYLGNT